MIVINATGWVILLIGFILGILFGISIGLAIKDYI